MGNVNIGKRVDYKTLETALVKAAEKVGWKTRIEDKFDKNYNLGSVQETKDYSHTIVHLKGRLFSAIKIYIPNKNQSNWFSIWQGLQHGIASEKRIKKYLSAVSENL